RQNHHQRCKMSCANASLRIKELVALAKKNPGKLNYSSSGAGGNNHFAGALFASAAGISLTHIPYKGISMAMTALASGEVEIVIASAAAINPQLKAGRVRALGVSSAEPSPLLPGRRRSRNPAFRDSPISCGGACSLRPAFPMTGSTSSMPRSTRYSPAPR
ncbi:MAG: tripartite tricarboxylate transporter substrate-binding protein, partial [Pseudomonadota bacterium]